MLFRSPALWKAGRIVALFLGFAVGFVLTANVVRLVLNQVAADPLDHHATKVRAAAGKQADLIFVGPSHIEMGVNPTVFDEEMLRYSKLRSYNMAVGSLGVPELEFLLKERFAVDSCCVKYVVLYPAFMLTDVARGHTGVLATHYFDLSNAVRYWSYLRGYKRTPDPQLDMMQYARNIAVAALEHQTNLGLALRPLGIWKNTLDASHEQYIAQGGHYGATSTMPESKDKDWRAAVDELLEAPRKFDGRLLSDRVFNRLVDIIDTVERHGARVIVVRPPSPWHWPYDVSFVRKFKQQCPDGPPLLDFGDPAEYPELYDRRNRYDVSHLNGRGAELWSRMLAERIGGLIQSGRLAHPAFCNRAQE